MIWGACMLVMRWLFVEQHLGIKCIPCHSHTYALKAVVCVCVCHHTYNRDSELQFVQTDL